MYSLFTLGASISREHVKHSLKEQYVIFTKAVATFTLIIISDRATGTECDQIGA